MSDFLVIGGGVAGLTAGAALAELGTVTLVEKEEALGYHASGRSAALFEESYGLPSTVALNRASAAAHHESGLLGPRGLLLIGAAGGAKTFEADMQALAMQRLTGDEARALVPVLDPGAASGFGYHAEAWDIDTDALLQRAARRIRAKGGRILLKAEVRELSRGTKGWLAETTAGPAEGGLLVNAAGPWADHVARLAGIQPMHLTPYRRSMARIPAPGGHDVAGWPMLLGAGETWYAKPDAGKLIVSPADEDAQEPHDAWADDMVLAEGLARYEAHMTEPVTRLETSWAGLRTFAPDRNLVIGFAPDARDVFWCAGQGGYGFQTAPAVSRLVADLVAGRTPEIDSDIIAALDPKRFG